MTDAAMGPEAEVAPALSTEPSGWLGYCASCGTWDAHGITCSSCGYDFLPDASDGDALD